MNTSSSLLVPLQPALDQRWLDQLSRIAGIAQEIYTVLGPSPTQLSVAKEEFFGSGKIHSPNLQPANLNYSSLKKHKQSLVSLADRIAGEENNGTIVTAYVSRIEELVANIDLLVAAGRGDYDEFARQNTYLYGTPDKAICVAALEWFRGPIVDPLAPASELFEQIRQLHVGPDGFFNKLFAGMQLPAVGSTVTQEAGEPLIRQLLHNLQADGYTVSDSPDASWSVSYVKKAVVRPHSYELTPEEFLSTLAHEVGSHLLERLNGQRQPLRLLSMGLDHYESGNEGRALLREQVFYSSWEEFCRQPRWREILLRHIAISLAVGADGTPRGFAEVFAIIQPLYAMWETGKDASSKADTRTWELLARVLNGTDGTKGAYLKDISYLQGNVECWRAAASDTGLILRGDEGKFDITNAAHLHILDSLASQ